MLKKIFKASTATFIAFISLLSSSIFAKPNDQTDRLADLIQTVGYSNPQDDIAQLEKYLLGRSSWNVQCWVKVFDGAKVCTLQKDHITVVRLNDDYSVRIGDQSGKNAKTALRVDQYQPLYTPNGWFRDANKLIEQFKLGAYVYTRYPNVNPDQDVDYKVALLGFSNAFQHMQQQFAQLDRQKAQNSL